MKREEVLTKFVQTELGKLIIKDYEYWGDDNFIITTNLKIGNEYYKIRADRKLFDFIFPKSVDESLREFNRYGFSSNMMIHNWDVVFKEDLPLNTRDYDTLRVYIPYTRILINLFWQDKIKMRLKNVERKDVNIKIEEFEYTMPPKFVRFRGGKKYSYLTPFRFDDEINEGFDKVIEMFKRMESVKEIIIYPYFFRKPEAKYDYNKRYLRYYIIKLKMIKFDDLNLVDLTVFLFSNDFKAEIGAYFNVFDDSLYFYDEIIDKFFLYCANIKKDPKSVFCYNARKGWKKIIPKIQCRFSNEYYTSSFYENYENEYYPLTILYNPEAYYVEQGLKKDWRIYVV